MHPQSLWSAVLLLREERLRLECESRVSVSKAGNPLLHNFYVRTDVNFNWLYVH